MTVGVEPTDAVVDRQNRFEAMFRAHYNAVTSYLRSQWGSVDAADTAAATFEIAWRRLDDIPAEATRGWLIGVARNCALNALRTARRRAAMVDAFTATHGHAAFRSLSDRIPIETMDALRQAFDSLRPADREVLLLATRDGLSGENLAAALGTSKTAAGVRLFRARDRLQTAYQVSESGER